MLFTTEKLQSKDNFDQRLRLILLARPLIGNELNTYWHMKLELHIAVFEISKSGIDHSSSSALPLSNTFVSTKQYRDL